MTVWNMARRNNNMKYHLSATRWQYNHKGSNWRRQAIKANLISRLKKWIQSIKNYLKTTSCNQQ